MATLLVVDDRPVNRDLVRTVLGYHGHHVLEASGGAEALELLSHEVPDLVIADMLMPGMDGYQLARAIRADPSTTALPVLFYTANYLEEEAGPLAAAVGVRRVIRKSGDLTELIEAIEDALNITPVPTGDVSSEDFSREHLAVLNAKLLEKVRELEEKERLSDLVDAAVSVSGDLNLADTSRRIVVAARSLVNAEYAALRVLADDGAVLEVVHDGERTHQRNPALEASVLSLPVQVQGEEYATLQVFAAGDSVFTGRDRAVLAAFSAAAAAAIANAQLYDDARRRQDWLSASGEITSALLATDFAEALELVVRGARRVAGARIAWIEMATENNGAIVNACDAGSAGRLGRVVAGDHAPLLEEIARTGAPIVIVDAATDPRVRTSPTVGELGIGPLLAVPLAASGRCLGALLIGNARHTRSFTKLDMEMATTFAGHAALALEVARAEADRHRLTVVDERGRIARDLHDVVIQRLFGIGLRLEGLGSTLTQSSADILTTATRELDETINDIRNTIFSLRGDALGRTLRTQLFALGDQAADALGFAPTLRLVGPIDSVVPDHIQADLLATVRETLANAARHASASAVHVELNASADQLILRITDNGCGLPENRRESGLANLRHRARALGGTMSTTAPGDGSGLMVVWWVPIGQQPLTSTAPTTSRRTEPKAMHSLRAHFARDS